MSGSGPSGGNLGGGGGIPITDCKGVSIKTIITSPNPSVLKTLKPGDILSIELQTATGPLIALSHNGKVVGSIFTTNPKLLIECINGGTQYQGKILSLDGADCQILITAR